MPIFPSFPKSNSNLSEPFSDNEIKVATSQLGQWKTPSPDGLPVGFFAKNWDLVGCDVIRLVRGMASGSISTSDFNYTDIVLIHKVQEQVTPADFRPISLCNSMRFYEGSRNC